ncbi:multidrug transporter [Acetobacteraceae bacterium]|nr:multidrug transporter [Acetobacteraceae bacterium]QCE33794.1 multidrug transporter [Acetobacteraceae bacterium]
MSGNIAKHVFVMAGTGSIGLIAIFMVDLLNFFYISALKNPSYTAAVAFAGSLGFILSAISIGSSIGISATVSRLIGAKKRGKARRYAATFLAVMLCIATLLAALNFIFSRQLVSLIGGKGEALEGAVLFLRILAPAFPLLCLVMAISGLLRSLGEANAAMRVTLSGAVCAAVLDPIFIFGLDLGLTGAALGTIFSRILICANGWYQLSKHDILAFPRLKEIKPALKAIAPIALPAIATNLATPVGNLFVTRTMSHFGNDAISALSVIERSVPICFAFIFALTGSIGPIIAQNFGARIFERVKETYRWALRFTLGCVALIWLIFFLNQNLLIKLFHIQGIGIPIIHFFCDYLVEGYAFLGLLFVSNTAFNNLGFAFYSTFFNWGRATLGTIPFVLIGFYWGPEGILTGMTAGMALFGTLAYFKAKNVIHNLHLRFPEALA